MKKRNLWGLFLIFCAFYLIADVAGWLVNMPGLFTTVVSMLLIGVSLSSVMKMDFYGMIMPLSFIAVLFSEKLNIDENTWSIVFAAFLLSSGLSVLFKKKNKRKISYSKNFGGNRTFEFSSDDEEGSDTQYSDEDHLKVEVSFSSRTRYVRSDNFTRADLECDFGQLDVYFTDVQFNPVQSEIVVDCNFGNINLYLPSYISVDNRVEVTLGSNGDDGINHFVEGAPVLRISGDVTLGALNIYYI